MIFDLKCSFLEICVGFRSACINSEVNLSLRKFPELFSFHFWFSPSFVDEETGAYNLVRSNVFIFHIKQNADQSGGLCGFCINFTAPVLIYFFGFHRLNLALWIFFSWSWSYFSVWMIFLLFWLQISCGIHFIPAWLKQHDGGWYGT